MKKLVCRDILPSECEWAILGADEDDVLRRAHEHLDRMHNGKTIDDAAMRPRIREA